MSVLPSAASGNRLLASLPRQELVRMLGICTPVELSFAEVLAEPGLPIRHVWFPTGCAIAQVVLIEGRITITPDGGTPVTVKAGDAFVVEPTFKGTWKIEENVRKHFDFRLK